jgi:Na+/H+ antiporter NhaD/arsenite permease-like protein
MRFLATGFVVLALNALQSAAAGIPSGPQGAPAEIALGQRLPLWSILPFAGILLSIALFPLAAPKIWHRHYPKVIAAWALAFALPFLWQFGGPAWREILHICLADYIPFIILLWGLFTVSGGILVSGTLRGTPGANTLLLAGGTALASWVGTTGASMLLIRPLLRANAWRRRRSHVVVFFIFLVGNVGGALTPLGDPPLFLGYLHGVPFFWTLNLLPHMGLVSGLLLGVFYLWDRVALSREPGAPAERPSGGGAKRRSPGAGASSEVMPRSGSLRLHGLLNLVWLGGIVGAVLASGIWDPGEVALGPLRLEMEKLVRDAVIVAMGLLSLRLTPRDIRRRNEFTWAPMREVAILFAGIFMTIIPVLAILKAGERGSLGVLLAAVNKPAHYFWATGALSSFLDNAPTYLAFFSSALGRFFATAPEAEAVRRLIAEHGDYLTAIAAGAVFMGANTYIGNAPNFMIKAIAEESGVRMPSFFGYMWRFSFPVLIPCFALVSWIFF